jgi:hypothetical protein
LRNFAPIVGSVVSHRSQRSCVYGAATLAFAFFSSACAYAVSERVQQACRDDYYQHCSQYSVGTEELRQCMRKVGEGLSAPCLVALVQDGEITKEDVDRHNAAKGEKNSTKKSSTEVPSKVPSKVASKDADDPKEVSSNGGKKKKKKAGKTTETTDPSKAKSGKTKKAATATDKKDIDPKAKTGKKAGKKAKKSAKKTPSGADAKAPADGTTIASTKGKKTGKAKSKTKSKTAETATKTKKPAKKSSSAEKSKKIPAAQAP